MYIIVGLGNPGKEYQGTRHNVGFDAITQLAADQGISLGKKGQQAITGKGSIQGEKVILAMPQTYMNLSGDSVESLLTYYKETPDHLLILSDDINLPPGQLRIRKGGSAGGHNGLKNIIARVGTDQFPRIRIGVGEKPKNMDLADYVLGHFSKEDRERVDQGAEWAAQAVCLVLREGIQAAMNEYNGKRQEEE